MNGDNPVKPKIDDQYWFELSEQMVRNTQQGASEAAEKLQGFVAWLWGIYTGGAAIGLTLSPQSFSRVQLIFIALGSFALVVVYWCAVYVQLPITVEFDPRSPTEIKNAYKLGVEEKNRRLRWTILFSGLAAMLMTLGLVWDKLNTPPSHVAPWFDVALHEQGQTRILALTGELGSGEEMSNLSKVIVKVQSTVSSSEKQTAEFALLPLGERGRLQTSLPLDFSADSLTVLLEWQGARETTMQLSKLITSWEFASGPSDTIAIRTRR